MKDRELENGERPDRKTEGVASDNRREEADAFYDPGSKRESDSDSRRESAPDSESEDAEAEVEWEDNEEDEAEEREYFERKARTRKRLKKGIAICLAVALVANVAAFWPMLYNLQAIRFLAISRELSGNEAVSQYKRTVVVVGTEDGKGTGFVISPDGHIVTNHHVVEGGGKTFVRFADGPSHEAGIVFSEASLDLAVLKIAPDDAQRAALPLEREKSWGAGTQVYVIGNPLFFSHIANVGTIIGEIPVRGLDVPAMAIEAPIYKGNSGSPVINDRGEAIGVVFATTEIERDGEKRNVGLAVPIAAIVPHLDKAGIIPEAELPPERR